MASSDGGRGIHAGVLWLASQLLTLRRRILIGAGEDTFNLPIEQPPTLTLALQITLQLAGAGADFTGAGVGFAWVWNSCSRARALLWWAWAVC